MKLIRPRKAVRRSRYYGLELRIPPTRGGINRDSEERRPIIADVDIFSPECDASAPIRQNSNGLVPTSSTPWHSYWYDDDVIGFGKEDVASGVITKSAVESDRSRTGGKLADPRPVLNNRTGHPEVDYEALYLRWGNKNEAQRHRTAKNEKISSLTDAQSEILEMM